MTERETPATLFHRTDEAAARAILADGFRDGRGNYMAQNEYTGVWLSDVPLDENEGAFGDVLLRVTMSDEGRRAMVGYEWIEDAKGYREWLAPAALVNEHARIAIEEIRPTEPEWIKEPE